MKNICFFNTVKFWGGGEKFYFEYALAFQAKGYQVYVVCSPGSVLSQKADAHGLKQFHISAGGASVLNPIKIARLVGFFKANKIDTVLFSTSQDLKLGGLTAKLAKVPHVVYRRGLAVPIKNRWTNRIIFQHFLTHILANSEETKKTIRQHLAEYIPEEKIRVIYNGVHLKEDDIQPVDFGYPGVILGNAGRLTQQKGQPYLIEVAKLLKANGLAFTLLIAGTGEMEAELKALIQAEGLEKEVILLGFVEDMDRFMNGIDIFLLSSTWEGFGYVLVEAMMKAKPVVAFDITSNPEIVPHEQAGFLVDYPDVAAFAEKTQLLIEDTALRVQMGEVGRKNVWERFRIEDRVEQLEAFLYEQ